MGRGNSGRKWSGVSKSRSKRVSSRFSCLFGSAQESDRPPTDVDFLEEDNRLD